jgi:hypothetical protein
MGLLEFGWINRNTGLHVPYGLSNVFGKPCSGSVLVSRHISVQVHTSEILFSYHLACKFGMNFVLNPEPCILILFFSDWPGPLKFGLVLMFEMWKLTSLDMWGRSCSQYAHCWLTPILTIHLYPKSLICTRLIGPNMKPQHIIGARSMFRVRHSVVGCNNIYEQEIIYWVKLGFR